MVVQAILVLLVLALLLLLVAIVAVVYALVLAQWIEVESEQVFRPDAILWFTLVTAVIALIATGYPVLVYHRLGGHPSTTHLGTTRLGTTASVNHLGTHPARDHMFKTASFRVVIFVAFMIALIGQYMAVKAWERINLNYQNVSFGRPVPIASPAARVNLLRQLAEVRAGVNVAVTSLFLAVLTLLAAFILCFVN